MSPSSTRRHKWVSLDFLREGASTPPVPGLSGYTVSGRTVVSPIRPGSSHYSLPTQERGYREEETSRPRRPERRNDPLERKRGRTTSGVSRFPWTEYDVRVHRRQSRSLPQVSRVPPRVPLLPGRPPARDTGRPGPVRRPPQTSYKVAGLGCPHPTPPLPHGAKVGSRGWVVLSVRPTTAHYAATRLLSAGLSSSPAFLPGDRCSVVLRVTVSCGGGGRQDRRVFVGRGRSVGLHSGGIPTGVGGEGLPSQPGNQNNNHVTLRMFFFFHKTMNLCVLDFCFISFVCGCYF